MEGRRVTVVEKKTAATGRWQGTCSTGQGKEFCFLIKNKKLIVKNILKITGSITHARTLNAQGAEIKSLL